MSRSPFQITRAYAACQFGLKFDDESAGTAWVRSVSGGETVGDISNEPVSHQPYTIKSLRNLYVKPIVIEQSLGVSNSVLRWVMSCLQRNPGHRSGSILHADFDGRVRFEREFLRAQIAEITFPTLNAAKADPGYLRVTIQPERVVTLRGSGTRLSRFKNGPLSKAWNLANFRLSLFSNGYIIDCEGVSKIESFTIEQVLQPLMTGDFKDRFPTYVPCGLKIPDLTITTSMSYSRDFWAWYRNFVARGYCGKEHEMTGYIEFLDHACERVLFTVELDGVGVKSIQADQASTEQPDIHTATVGLYVEEMNLIMEPPGRRLDDLATLAKLDKLRRQFQ